jgi:hypothetical protein
MGLESDAIAIAVGAQQGGPEGAGVAAAKVGARRLFSLVIKGGRRALDELAAIQEQRDQEQVAEQQNYQGGSSPARDHRQVFLREVDPEPRTMRLRPFATVPSPQRVNK